MHLTTKLFFTATLLAGNLFTSFAGDVTLKITKKYINLPVSHQVDRKKMTFEVKGTPERNFVIRLADEKPDYWVFCDVSSWKGKTLRISYEGESAGLEKIYQDDVIAGQDSLYAEKNRPQFHFTTRRGWINDPNGLVFYEGEYHLFYQHNPYEREWENMHWGGAVSDDLIHWEEIGDVLFPDKDGTMFSGSAIIDKKNLTGLQSGNEPAILYFYTSAGNTSETSKGKPFTQCLAYSNDGGKTLIKYDKNPIIKNIIKENRDPKVIYCEPDDSYIMVLFLDGHSFAILKSKNLLDWSQIQEITLPDDGECPDFYPLCADGDSKNIKWIFSAASDRYYIGSFDGNKFIIETEQKRLNFGNASYAAQSWSDIPNGRRVRTAFASFVIPNNPFGSCLNIPQNMTIKTINGEPYLSALPVKEFETLYKNRDVKTDVVINSDMPFIKSIQSKACDISVSASAENSFSLELFGLKMSFNADDKILQCLDISAPLKCENGTVDLRIIFDTLYTEIFADFGTVFMGMTYIADSNLNSLRIESKNATIHNIRVSELNSIH